jgi:hypothetical protein
LFAIRLQNENKNKNRKLFSPSSICTFRLRNRIGRRRSAAVEWLKSWISGIKRDCEGNGNP